MSQYSEYVAPLVRQTFVSAPVISGYVTVRLRAQDDVTPTISGHDQSLHVLCENTSTGTFALDLQVTDDRSISGVRTIVASVGLVPGGHDTVDFATKAAFLEVKGTVGSGNLRMQINAQRRWTEQAFAKDDPFYPPQLFQAKLPA